MRAVDDERARRPDAGRPTRGRTSRCRPAWRRTRSSTSAPPLDVAAARGLLHVLVRRAGRRRSSARSTARPFERVRRSPTSSSSTRPRSASTRSGCAPPTSRATPTRRRPSTRGRSPVSSPRSPTDRRSSPPRSRASRRGWRDRGDARRRSTFEANVADATFRCSLDAPRSRPCTSPSPTPGSPSVSTLFRVIAIDPEGERADRGHRVRVDDHRPASTPCRPTRRSRAVRPTRTVRADLHVHRHRQRHLAAGADVRVPARRPGRGRLRRRAPARGPARTLDVPEPLAAGAAHLRRAGDRRRGQHRPDAGDPDLHVCRRHDRAHRRDHGPARRHDGRPTSRARFTANDPFATLRVLPRRGALRAVRVTARGDRDAVGPHTSPCARPTSPATSARRPRSTWTCLAAPETTLTVTPPAESVRADGDLQVRRPTCPDRPSSARWTAGPCLPCTSPPTLTGLADGDHTSVVRGSGRRLRRRDARRAHLDRRRGPADTTPPGDDDRQRARLRSPPSTTATFTFSSTDPGAGFECAPRRRLVRHACTSPLRPRARSPRATTSSRSGPSTPPATPTRRPATHAWTVDGPAGGRPSPSGPGRTHRDDHRDVRLHLRRARLDLRLLARRRRRSPCTSPETYTGLARRATTSSRCGRPTPPATSRRSGPSGSGRSPRPSPRHDAHRRLADRPRRARRPRPSPSRPTRRAPSSAPLDGGRSPVHLAGDADRAGCRPHTFARARRRPGRQPRRLPRHDTWTVHAARHDGARDHGHRGPDGHDDEHDGDLHVHARPRPARRSSARSTARPSRLHLAGRA